ncbi:MAG: glycosyltransferase family 4 protein [Nitrococcus mobilis]|nr:glycosyltransferase family 4 protein [Nitrococcus mobilis]
MKVLLLSRYDRLGASSRVRMLQYLRFLEARSWRIDVSFLFSNGYLEALYEKRALWREVVSGYWRRVGALARIGSYDLIWMEKELFPFMPAFVERLLATFQVPYIVDYDDALFHRYDRHNRWIVRKTLSRKIDAVMKNAAVVVAGNDYLAQRARIAGARRIEIVPTVVDLDRYPAVDHVNAGPTIIGWVGSPATSRYLLDIAPSLEAVKRNYDVRLVAIGAGEAAIEGLPIEIWPWSEETEVASIRAFDIGIMPLRDGPWERGKCGYKLIQYMACGLPVVASPVGVNTDIVQHGISGFMAEDLEEWEQGLANLLENHVLRTSMGIQGRRRVEEWYSLQVQVSRLEGLMRKVLE